MEINEIIRIILIFFIFAIYIIGVYFARYFWIVKPTRKLLRAQIDGILSRNNIEKKEAATTQEKIIFETISSLLEKAKEKTNSKREEKTLREHIICEDYLPSWRLVHDAERQAVDLMTLEQIKVRLGTARDELNEMKEHYSKELAERIDYDLKEDCPKGVGVEKYRALLKESLRIIYDDRDNSYATLATWHNKALWLIGATIGLIIILSIMVGNEILFLIGGIGGLLSLLRRITKVPRLPTDYGAYWTTFFYSPLIGALAGWGGIFLTAFLVKANIIGDFFKFGWDGCYKNLSPEVIGFTIAFGYSGAMFEKLTERLENITSEMAQH